VGDSADIDSFQGLILLGIGASCLLGNRELLGDVLYRSKEDIRWLSFYTNYELYLRMT
jgi:hypothetical protein